MEEYKNLGLDFTNRTPIRIGLDTYEAASRVLQYGANSNCLTGSCVGTNVAAGYIDIVLTACVGRLDPLGKFVHGFVGELRAMATLLGQGPHTATRGVDIPVLAEVIASPGKVVAKPRLSALVHLFDGVV